jgi:hypothetical protein
LINAKQLVAKVAREGGALRVWSAAFVGDSAKGIAEEARVQRRGGREGGKSWSGCAEQHQIRPCTGGEGTDYGRVA